MKSASFQALNFQDLNLQVRGFRAWSAAMIAGWTIGQGLSDLELLRPAQQLFLAAHLLLPDLQLLLRPSLQLLLPVQGFPGAAVPIGRPL